MAGRKVKSVNYSISAATPLTYGALRKAETGDYQALPNQPKGNGHMHHRLGEISGVCSSSWG